MCSPFLGAILMASGRKACERRLAFALAMVDVVPSADTVLAFTIWSHLAVRDGSCFSDNRWARSGSPRDVFVDTAPVHANAHTAEQFFQ